MSKFQEMKEFAACLRIALAVVRMKPGESHQEAWIRHLEENPGDISATLKIFEQPVPPGGPAATNAEKAEKF
jgi:hypothetical protein